ncbi:UDP-4-amino-4,6-dideoxy-N-acetyl-beta-L-altrosamine N-acetyltransferase [Marinobacter sp. OP 3.4]|uniref:UDP-4-amino-4, 6-dideoxy-N-acetyl-beta-L-altrosamine N-acetyltransferase n=1 Tax=Marinobacter sp. OP 3.4 TaxID=3076501 RepID=UPI002E201B56
MSLRKVGEQDLELMLSWRNNPVVRASMFSQDVIHLNQHREWFRRESAKQDSAWFLFIDANKNPAGVVYFTNMDRIANHVFWGFYAAPGATPGTGTKMGIEALDYIFDTEGFHKVNAEVLETNERSYALHKKLGFRIEGTFNDHYLGRDGYESVTRFALMASEWSDLRKGSFFRKNTLIDLG